MNVLEQLQSLGFREEPYRFDTGGGTFDGYAGVDGGAGSGTSGVTDADIAAADAIASLGLNMGRAGQTAESMAAADIISGIMARGGASIVGAATKSDLQALENLGYGRMEGLNTENPTQSVHELIASANVQAAAPLAISLIPGSGIARGIEKGAQFVSDLASGKASPGQAAVDLALNFVADQLGVNKGTAVAMINGDFGKTAGTLAMGVFNSALAQTIGAPTNVVGAFMGITGAGKAIGSEIASAVNAATGVAPTDNVGAMGRALDQAFGVGPGGTSTGATGTDVSDVAGVIGGDGAPGVVDTTETDVAGGPSSVAPAGFDLSGLAPLLGVAALEDILTPKEKEEQEKEQKRIASPFGMMPYA